jgi:hypothetical protein
MIKMSETFGLGTGADMAFRLTQLRIDSEEVRARVQRARDYIFKHGRVPNNVDTEAELKEGSFTAVKVWSPHAHRCF